jgi:hypothetical protein
LEASPLTTYAQPTHFHEAAARISTEFLGLA